MENITFLAPSYCKAAFSIAARKVNASQFDGCPAEQRQALIDYANELDLAAISAFDLFVQVVDAQYGKHGQKTASKAKDVVLKANGRVILRKRLKTQKTISPKQLMEILIS